MKRLVMFKIKLVIFFSSPTFNNRVHLLERAELFKLDHEK